VIEAFWLSLGIVLLAELGDKSQLMALAFAARYPGRTGRSPPALGHASARHSARRGIIPWPC
jgi:hypothetical protein